MHGIVDGLRAAHQMGVIHRDIKPPNILFDQNGNPVITDFGVAHMPLESSFGLDDADDAALRVAGTPDYMAPEQMVFGSTIDGRVDLYAAGLLLYEMLTGERLFNFGPVNDLDELHRKVQHEDPERLVKFPSDVSAGTREIVLKLIQKNPAHRYPDARSVLMAIEAARVAFNRPATPETVGLTTEIVLDRQEMYRDILRLFLVDGVISAPERRELSKRAERLGVKPEIARELEEEIRRELGLPLLEHLIEYESMMERLLGNGEFSDKDRNALAKLARKHHISQHEQRKIQDTVMFKFHTKDEPDTSPPAEA